MKAPQRRVRALIRDISGRYVVIERRKPGREPYLVLPGGGVEAGESTLDALRREVMEELGAVVDIGEMIPVRDTATTVYRCTLVSLDSALRCGPEFEDETRGEYIERRITPEDLRASRVPLFPEDIFEHL